MNDDIQHLTPEQQFRLRVVDLIKRVEVLEQQMNRAARIMEELAQLMLTLTRGLK